MSHPQKQVGTVGTKELKTRGWKWLTDYTMSALYSPSDVETANGDKERNFLSI